MTAATVDPVEVLDVAEQPARRRIKVVHYYWQNVGEFCLANRIPVVPYICGRVSKTPAAAKPRLVETVGRLMAVPEKRDCRNCLRVFEAYLRRTA